MEDTDEKPLTWWQERALDGELQLKDLVSATHSVT